MIRTMINNKLRKQIRQAIPSYRGKKELLPLLADEFNIDDFCMLFVRLFCIEFILCDMLKVLK